MKKIKKISFETWLESNTRKILSVCDIGGLNIVFSSKEKEVNSEFDSVGTVVFSINYTKSYKTAHISHYPMARKLYKEGNINILFTALAHEIAHIYSNPLTELALQRFVAKKNIIDANEELTENIGMLIRRAIEERDQKGRKNMKLYKHEK